MASATQVKKYLAYWFQLGKRVIVSNSQKTFLPSKIYSGDRYAREFETCWQEIISLKPGDVYLDGTSQSLQDLLSPLWEINPCARCDMPVPTIVLGLAQGDCPCADLENWPNSELPGPRDGVNTKKYLNNLSQRLDAKESD